MVSRYDTHTQFTSSSSVDMRNISHFFLKAIKMTTNKLMLFQYFFTLKTMQILFFIEKYYSSPKIIDHI